MRATRIAVAILLMGGLTVTLAGPASAHKAKRYDRGATGDAAMRMAASQI